MSTYFIGDVHGCYKNLNIILNQVHFNPNTDYLYLTGDLVARGPDSLNVLRLIRSFRKNACTVLGNHDLTLLQTYFGLNNKKFKDYFYPIFNAPDLDQLMHWLLHQPLLYVDENKKILMSHAGIYPKWDIQQTKFYAKEIEKILVSESPEILFNDNFQYNTQNLIKHPNPNNLNLKKIRNHINCFTKMRYLDISGKLNLQFKDDPKFAPKNIYPWFNFLNPIYSEYSIIFGHWASLTNTQIPIGFYGLDSGCCWGGSLTLLRWEDKKIIHTPCNPIP